MSKVYLVSAKRTAIGSHLGALKNVSAPDMAAACIKAVIEETQIDPSNLDEVIIGNILPAGQKQGVGRQSSLKGGVPVTVPAYSINIACGSGMKAVMLATNSIKSGFAEMIIAGGTETMSQSPYLVNYNVRTGVRMGAMNMEDHMLVDALWDAFDGSHMGVTAENIVTKYGFTRQEQDAFAMSSQSKAIAAIDAGKFKDEIVPLEVKVGKDVVIFDTDEYPNRKTTLEKLTSLRPAFKKDGSVTAGNASGINDGASVMLIASEDAVNKYNLKPMAEIVGFGQGGVEPSIMGLGPTPAIRMALKNAELKLGDIDLFELNEAFAAQALGVIKEISEEHGVSKEEILSKCNVNGGAIALGHPVGASGNRIMTTLVYEMKKRDVTYGLASLCIGGGMGTAIILKNVNK
ncbi:MAG: acetyl-CoA C-acetyltransferase [Erysipelotrichaceae bacterium]|nr:acetyl-CoA C-acetyltransferase [Erysipelotrichaceae bacterium]